MDSISIEIIKDLEEFGITDPDERMEYIGNEVCAKAESQKHVLYILNEIDEYYDKL